MFTILWEHLQLESVENLEQLTNLSVSLWQMAPSQGRGVAANRYFLPKSSWHLQINLHCLALYLRWEHKLIHLRTLATSPFTDSFWGLRQVCVVRLGIWSLALHDRWKVHIVWSSKWSCFSRRLIWSLCLPLRLLERYGLNAFYLTALSTFYSCRERENENGRKRPAGLSFDAFMHINKGSSYFLDQSIQRIL